MVERAVSPGGTLAVDLVQPLPQSHDRLWIGEIGWFVEQARQEGLPSLLFGLDLVGQGLGHPGAERLVVPGTTSAAEYCEFTGKPPLLEEFKQGRDQLAVGEIATGSEDDQALGCNHPFLPEADPQGVGEYGLHREKRSRCSRKRR